MAFVKSSCFQSDQIDILFDYDGTETKQIANWSRRYEVDFPFRVVFAINQFYPELRSGSYLNKRLIALVQEAICAAGLCVVIEDNFQSDGIVPKELAGSLGTGDDYLLVDETMHIQGRLSVWESLGGESPFYHDRYILEIVTVDKKREELVRAVLQECHLKSITCKQVNPTRQS
jgi:hypothetical protein